MSKIFKHKDFELTIFVEDTDFQGFVYHANYIKYFERARSNFLTPGSSEAGNTINYYYVKRIQDVGDYTNATDVPYRFVPCMVSGLSFYLSQKFNPQLVQQMKMLYEDELNRALTEDGSSSSSFITPKTYYPNI